jgi:predicted ArsR family transcriptional regulator
MDVRTLLAPDPGGPLGESRARVLEMLRAAASPLGVQQVAERMGIHPNTARFHLDALAEAGLVIREPLPRSTPGRPGMAYRAVDGGAPAGQRRYRLLAEMLTTLITGVMPDPGEAAVRAGQEWGRYLTEQPAPYQRTDADQAVERLSAMLAELGFEPQAETGKEGYRIRLHQCPFREVAKAHQDVVCGLHLGIMQGALAQMRAPLSAGHLQPFAEPSVCIARLDPQRDQAAQRRARNLPVKTPSPGGAAGDAVDGP